jgi:hypothetical protein
MFLFAGLYRFTHAVLNKKEVSERFAITKMSWAESLSHLLKQTTSSNTNLSSTFSWAFSELYPRWQFSELKSRWNFPSPILEVFRFLKHRWLYSEFKPRWLYSEFKRRWLYSEFKPRWQLWVQTSMTVFRVWTSMKISLDHVNEFKCHFLLVPSVNKIPIILS